MIALVRSCGEAMKSDRRSAWAHGKWLLGAAVLLAATFQPNLVLGTPRPALDLAIAEIARLTPDARVEALISLRSVTRPAKALDLLSSADEVLALYHGWRGSSSDYVGGFEFVGDGATLGTELAAYRASYEEMLRETLANIERSAAGASGADAAAWASARRDAEDRLAAFLAGDLPLVGARVWARAEVLAAWSGTASSDIRLIEPAQAGRSVTLPWR
jgi:hypothetical protein